MKLNRVKKGSLSLIMGSLVAAIGIIIIVAVFSGVFQTLKDYDDGQVNGQMSSQELPTEVSEKLESIVDNIKPPTNLSVTRWEIDKKRKNIILYEADMDKDLISELQGKNIAGWKITVLEDTEYLNEKAYVWEELMKLENDHKLQIAGFVTGDQKEIIMWVYKFIPENRGLNGMKIRNWTIHTFVSPTPPPTPSKT